MNSVTIKIIVFFLSLFILITVSSQIYLAFQNDYQTETAVSYTTVEKAVFNGVFIRDEEVIKYSGDGVLGYPHPDGSKMPKNSVVAYVYRSESDITSAKKIVELEEQLASLKKVSNPGTFDVAQPELISGLISEEYRNAVYSAETNDFEQLSGERKKLTEYFNIMSLVTGREDNFDAEMSSLQSQIDNLKSGLSEPVDEVYTEKPGYFVSYVDGYEDILNYDLLETISVSDINKIISNPDTKSNAGVGKIINGYSWKMVGVIDNSKGLYTVGSKVTLSFATTPEEIIATIEDIRSSDNPNESIVVLSSDKLTFRLVQHRVERVEMVTRQYDGIYVPRKAIRFNNNGDKGVYVLMGQGIIFKKLDVVYEGEDYVLSSNSGSSDYVLLYDDIIVEGISAQDELNAGTIDDPENDEEETSATTTTGFVVGDISETTAVSVISETVSGE